MSSIPAGGVRVCEGNKNMVRTAEGVGCGRGSWLTTRGTSTGSGRERRDRGIGSDGQAHGRKLLLSVMQEKDEATSHQEDRWQSSPEPGADVHWWCIAGAAPGREAPSGKNIQPWAGCMPHWVQFPYLLSCWQGGVLESGERQREHNRVGRERRERRRQRYSHGGVLIDKRALVRDLDARVWRKQRQIKKVRNLRVKGWSCCACSLSLQWWGTLGATSGKLLHAL